MHVGVCVCVCVWDTWSLNRVFRMSVCVCFSNQGSLQRSLMPPCLENKHSNRHTDTHTQDHFLVRRLWQWSRDLFIFFGQLSSFCMFLVWQSTQNLLKHKPTSDKQLDVVVTFRNKETPNLEVQMCVLTLVSTQLSFFCFLLF